MIKKESLFPIIPTAIVAGALMMIIGGCDEAQDKDAETSGQRVDRSAAEVIAMPDGYGNLATKCDGHGHRIYVTSNDGDDAVSNTFVIDDARCVGGER